MDPRQQLELNPHSQHRAGHHGNVHEQRCSHVGHHLDFHVDQHDRVRRRRPGVFVHGSERRNLHHHRQHHQQSLTRTGLHRQCGLGPDGRQWGLCRNPVASGRRHGHDRTFQSVFPAEDRRQRRQHLLRCVCRQWLAGARRRSFADADRRQQRRQYRHHRRRSQALRHLLGPGAHDQRRLAHRRRLDDRRGRNAHRHQRRHAHHHQFRRCRQHDRYRRGLDRNRERRDRGRLLRTGLAHDRQRRRVQQPRGSEIDTSVPELGIPSVLVTGPGSTWNVGGPALLVGTGSTEGPGMLTIANSGVVNVTGFMAVGDVTGASTVTVTGAGSVLNALDSLTIGDSNCGCNLGGTLTVADGGVVNSPGPTSIGAGSTLNLGVGGLAGAIVTPAIVNDGQIAANFIDTLTLATNVSGAGALSKAGPGTLILTGNNPYTGATTINGGTAIVNGSIANSTVTVNAGGRLGGTGTLGNTIINGGTLSPGNSIGTLTVNGNLAMTAAASYLVEISPTNADRTNVTGTATLAGTVQAAFAAGSFMTRNYTILSAAGGRSGTFNALPTTTLPAGFSASLSYTATDVILNLTAALGGLTPLGAPNAPGTCAFSINQCNVANAINAFFNNGGTLPPAFANLFGLTGVNLGNALTQLSGEAATGAQQAAFQLTNQFLGIMLDPFVDGRSGVAGTGGPALGFAPEREELPDDIALAYAKVLKAPPKPANFEQRWSVWGAGYGGGNRTSGDPAVVGSHDLSARTAGGAAGLDYHLSRDSVVGVALAGGGTNWSLAQGLGTGKRDAFRAGVYGAT